jgi:tellurite resistance protein TerC
MTLFPFADYWWAYAAFLGMVVSVLLIDLGVFNKTPHAPSFKEASLWTLAWLGLAGLFNLGLYEYSLIKFASLETANKVALEFLAGFVVEKTLAVDNIFVFAMVFSYFKVPAQFQHRVLFWGIIGALGFRAVFIGIGSVLMDYHAVVIGFGILLILTGLKMAFQKEEGDLNDKWIIRQIKKLLLLTDNDEAGSFFIRKSGVLYMTPLFLALAVIELSDIIFAIDSVPAIFSLTSEPLIVFTSNIMAILGLRSMYFMVSGFMEKFQYIKYGLAAVLVFVGLKMSFLNQFFDGKFPITWSLMIILGLVLCSILASLFMSRRMEKKKIFDTIST